jgi:hypothetical protein
MRAQFGISPLTLANNEDIEQIQKRAFWNLQTILHLCFAADQQVERINPGTETNYVLLASPT